MNLRGEAVTIVGTTVAALSGVIAANWLKPDETKKMDLKHKDDLRAKVSGYIDYDEKLRTQSSRLANLYPSLRREWREHSSRGAELESMLRSEFDEEVADRFHAYIESPSTSAGETFKHELDIEIEAYKKALDSRWRKNVIRVAIALTVVVILVSFAITALAIVKDIEHSLKKSHHTVSEQIERHAKQRRSRLASGPVSVPRSIRVKHHEPRTTPSMAVTGRSGNKNTSACTSCTGKTTSNSSSLIGQLGQTLQGVARWGSETLSSVGGALGQILSPAGTSTPPAPAPTISYGS